MDTPVLADQQKLDVHQFYADIGYILKDLPRVMVNRDGWQEGVKRNPAVGTP